LYVCQWQGPVVRVRGGRFLRVGGFEDAEQVALQAALDLARCLALREAAGGIDAGGRVVLQTAEHDGVQRAVELTIAGAVEPVADRLSDDAGIGAAPPSMAKAPS
jgi:hypothetical protein